MPLFGSKKETPPAPPPPAAPPTKSNRTSLFSRLTPNSPSTTTSSSTGSKTTTDPAAHTTKSSHSILSGGATTGTGLLHRNHEDGSITRARERLLAAEQAEREADKALGAARGAVKSARAELKRLELEAAEEARLAKIKQGQAASLSKRGKLLGRHDNHV